MKKVLILLIAIILVGCNQDSEDPNESDLPEQSENAIEDKETPDVDEDQTNDQTEEPNQDETKDDEVDEDGNEQGEDNNNGSNTDSSNEEDQSQDNPSEEDQSIVVSNPHATDVVVNKVYRLPSDFVPQNLIEPAVPMNAKEDAPKRLMRQEAAQALEQLFAAANDAGYELVAQSGYRSIKTQTWLYNHYVETYGQDWADQYSAVPGHSEHHTGLAMDVTAAVVGMELTEDFGYTEPGRWVANHAHEFGFVIRYPEGKSHITGYSYEPWHLRYFGEELATDIYESGLTVEEYYGLVE